jgi:hypothetical protein
MRKIQLGLIGCGMIGQSFIQNALQNPYADFKNPPFLVHGAFSLPETNF